MGILNLLKNCEHATFLISKGQEAHLSKRERLWLGLHLWGCRFCKRFKKQTDLVQKFLSEYLISGKEEMDNRKKAEIEKMLNDFSE